MFYSYNLLLLNCFIAISINRIIIIPKLHNYLVECLHKIELID